MKSPRSEPNGREIDFQLWRLIDHTRYMIFRLREKELAQFNVTPEQAFVLDIIHASGGSTTINRVVEFSQHKHNSISALINRMAKQGLVRKYRTRRDKRAFRILSTEKGNALLLKVPRDSIHRSLACLTQGDKKRLATLLTQLRVGVYQAAGVSLHDPGAEPMEDGPQD